MPKKGNKKVRQVKGHRRTPNTPSDDVTQSVSAANDSAIEDGAVSLTGKHVLT